MCANSSTNIRVLHSELSPTILTDYLRRCIAKDISSSATQIITTTAAAANSSDETIPFNAVEELKKRIPREMWETLANSI